MAQLLVRPKVTREEYQALAEGPPYYELIGGELVEMTRSTEDHNEIGTALVVLFQPYRRVHGGSVSWEPNLYLPGVEDVYHPDLVFLTAGNLRIRKKKGIFGTPDVICEIRSPSREKKDRGVKMEHFRQAGVPHVWLVDPTRPVMVEEFVLGEHGRYVLHATTTAPDDWEPAAFPGWRVSLAELDEAVAPLEE